MGSPSGRATAVGLLSVALISVSLRPSLTSISPLASEIAVDIGWTESQLGLLSTVLLATLAVSGLLVSYSVRQLGERGVMSSGLALIFCGTALRFFGGILPEVLLATSVLAGLGIGLVSGVLPQVIGGRFANQQTGFFSGSATLLIVGAAAAAALTVPLERLFGSWPLALAVWACIPLLGLIAYMIESREVMGSPSVSNAVSPSPRGSQVAWLHSRTWLLGAFLGLNSFLFYALLAWLPASLTSRGWSPVEAATLLSVGTMSQLVGTLAVGRIHMFETKPYGSLSMLSLASAALFAAMAVWADRTNWVIVPLVSISLGATFALALSLLPGLAERSDEIVRHAGLVTAVMYGIAALAPWLTGWLVYATESWPAVYVVLAVVALGQVTLMEFKRRTLRNLGART